MTILLVGAFGRMGEEIQKIAKAKKIACLTVDRKGRGNYKKISDVLEKIDCVIDFSSEAGLADAARWCEKTKTPLVSGTTGLNSKSFSVLKKISNHVPVLWAANMSLGVHVLRQCIKQLSQLDEDFDFQIEDIHHKFKKDSPSGTAKVLQEDLIEALGKKKSRAVAPVISIRAGGIFGIHKVLAVSQEEILLLEHTALNRAVFAKGAIVAAKWLSSKKPGYYSFEDIFE